MQIETCNYTTTFKNNITLYNANSIISVKVYPNWPRLKFPILVNAHPVIIVPNSPNSTVIDITNNPIFMAKLDIAVEMHLAAPRRKAAATKPHHETKNSLNSNLVRPVISDTSRHSI